MKTELLKRLDNSDVLPKYFTAGQNHIKGVFYYNNQGVLVLEASSSRLATKQRFQAF